MLIALDYCIINIHISHFSRNLANMSIYLAPSIQSSSSLFLVRIFARWRTFVHVVKRLWFFRECLGVCKGIEWINYKGMKFWNGTNIRNENERNRMEPSNRLYYLFIHYILLHLGLKFQLISRWNGPSRKSSFPILDIQLRVN